MASCLWLGVGFELGLQLGLGLGLGLQLQLGLGLGLGLRLRFGLGFQLGFQLGLRLGLVRVASFRPRAALMRWQAGRRTRLFSWSTSLGLGLG